MAFSVLDFISATKTQTKLGTLVLDALVSEEVDFAGEVTKYPVEDGTTISDNVIQGVETVRISGMVSTASIAAFTLPSIDIAGILNGDTKQTKLVDAIEALRAMHKARALVSVSTGQMLYTDMAFANLNAVRTNDERGGNWLTIKCELVKVRKVSLRKAEVPADRAQGAAAGRAGATNTAAGKSSGTSGSGAAASETAATTDQTPFMGLLGPQGRFPTILPSLGL